MVTPKAFIALCNNALRLVWQARERQWGRKVVTTIVIGAKRWQPLNMAEVTKPDIFQYTDFRRFLKDWALYAQSRNPRWSYGLWARKMGLTSKSTLIMILNGQRSPGKGMMTKLVASLGLSEDEAKYFERLVAVQKRTPDPMMRVMLLKAETQQERSGQQAPRWLFFVLREMTQMPGFEENVEWVNERFLEPVAESDFKGAIELCLNEGALVRDEAGKLQPGRGEYVPPWGRDELLQFHQDGINASGRAMEQVAVPSRVFQTSFLKIRQDKVEQARLLIQAFQKEMGKLLEETEDADSVYQLNLQLFPITRPKKT